MVLGGLAGVSCTGRRGTNMFVFLFVVFLFFLQCSNRMVLGWLAGGQTGGLAQCGAREEVTDFCLCLFCMFLSFSLSYTVARARWVLSFLHVARQWCYVGWRVVRLVQAAGRK